MELSLQSHVLRKAVTNSALEEHVFFCKDSFVFSKEKSTLKPHSKYYCAPYRFFSLDKNTLNLSIRHDHRFLAPMTAASLGLVRTN